MMKGSMPFNLKNAGTISKALIDVLACPLSKQPLRYCQETQSLISDAIGASFPVIDGIPCLIPKDGKILEGGKDRIFRWSYLTDHNRIHSCLS